MNNEQDAVAAAVSILDLDHQLLHRVRNGLTGMSDVYLTHGLTLTGLRSRDQPRVGSGDGDSRCGANAGIDHQIVPAARPVLSPSEYALFLEPRLF
jgi:hypothetical protein